MTAPSSGEFSNTFASNNASVYYDEAGGTVNNQLISNTVHSIYIKNAVGVGGLVFLDKNMDGIRDDNERLIPEIPVKLYVYENGKLKDVLVTETGDDGRYYFDDLIPAFVKDGAFDGNYYQYQIEFDIPDGARLTSPILRRCGQLEKQ